MSYNLADLQRILAGIQPNQGNPGVDNRTQLERIRDARNPGEWEAAQEQARRLDERAARPDRQVYPRRPSIPNPGQVKAEREGKAVSERLAAQLSEVARRREMTGGRRIGSAADAANALDRHRYPPGVPLAPQPPIPFGIPHGPENKPPGYREPDRLFSDKNYNEAQYYEALLNAADEQYSRPYEGYAGPRFAPENQYEFMSNDLSSRLNTMNPYMMNAQRQAQLGQQSFPQQMQDYMNPYQKYVADRIATEGNRNLTEKILPALQAKFVRLGQSGGKNHREELARVGRDIQGEISARQNQAMHAGYGQAADIFGNDQARRMQAAEQQGQFGQLMNAARLADVRNLQDVGERARFRAEAPMKVAEAEHLNRLRHNIERFNLYKSVSSGAPTQPLVQQSTPKSYHRNDWQNLLGRGGAGVLGQLFSKGGHVRGY